MFLTFAVRPLHPCFHGSLCGVPSMPLRAAIYRSLLLYCNRTLNAFRPRGSPAAARFFFFPQVETTARVNAAIVAVAAGEIKQDWREDRNGSDERSQLVTHSQSRLKYRLLRYGHIFEFKKHFP